MDKETHRLLHVLWTKAVGTPDYDKREWKALEQAIEDAQGMCQVPAQSAQDAKLAALDGQIDAALRHLVDVLFAQARRGG